MPSWGKDKLVICKRNTVTNNEGEILMSQFTIVGFLGYHIRLHWFSKADTGWYHNHPRTFYTLCLCGSYCEQIWTKGERLVKLGTFSVITPERAHSVIPLQKPCITLVFATPVVCKFRRWQNVNKKENHNVQ